MRRIVLALCLALAAPVRAQSDYTHVIARAGNVEFINHHPACNPFAMAHDPVWVNGWGWTMPRLGWHVMYPVVNAGIKRGLQGIGVPRRVASTVAFIGLPLVPHLRQAALGLKHGDVYQLNLFDWLYDFHNRNAINYRDAHAVGAWIVGDVALSCFARP